MPLDQTTVAINDLCYVLKQFGKSIREEEAVLALIATRACIEIRPCASSNALTHIAAVDIQPDIRSADQGEQFEETRDP